jgi:hypothetical protein
MRSAIAASLFLVLARAAVCGEWVEVGAEGKLVEAVAAKRPANHDLGAIEYSEPMPHYGPRPESD